MFYLCWQNSIAIIWIIILTVFMLCQLRILNPLTSLQRDIIFRLGFHLVPFFFFGSRRLSKYEFDFYSIKKLNNLFFWIKTLMNVSLVLLVKDNLMTSDNLLLNILNQIRSLGLPIWFLYLVFWCVSMMSKLDWINN